MNGARGPSAWAAQSDRRQFLVSFPRARRTGGGDVFHFLAVGAESGRPVAARPEREGLAAGSQILILAVPGHQRRILERATVREADGPGLRPGQPIDRIQMG